MRVPFLSNLVIRTTHYNLIQWSRIETPYGYVLIGTYIIPKGAVNETTHHHRSNNDQTYR